MLVITIRCDPRHRPLQSVPRRFRQRCNCGGKAFGNRVYQELAQEHSRLDSRLNNQRNGGTVHENSYHLLRR